MWFNNSIMLLWQDLLLILGNECCTQIEHSAKNIHLNLIPLFCCLACFAKTLMLKLQNRDTSFLMVWYCCLTGSRQSWVMTSWRSMMGQTFFLLWLAPLMVPRCLSSCSAAATFCICCLPPITADQMLASRYYTKVSQKQKQHVYAYNITAQT